MKKVPKFFNFITLLSLILINNFIKKKVLGIFIHNHTQTSTNINNITGSFNYFSIKRIYDQKLPYNDCYKNVSKSYI